MSEAGADRTEAAGAPPPSEGGASALAPAEEARADGDSEEGADATVAVPEPAPLPRGPRTWPVHLLLSTVSFLLSALPRLFVYYVLGYVLALLVFLVAVWREPKANRKGRGAQRNMRIAFGDDLDRRRLRALTWRYARHVAWVVLETLRLPKLTPARRDRWVDWSALEADVLPRIRRGEGLIAASGHFGNWEVLAHVAGLLELPITSLARPCPEAGMQRWLLGNRQRSGGRMISKFGGMSPLVATLKAGAVAGLNVDENMRKGVFVPFCGVLAATNPSVFLLQRRAHAAVAVLSCQRVAPERYKLHVWRFIPPEETRALPREEGKAFLLREVAAGFERALVTYPEQWLWSLRRWETRPPEEGGGRGAELPPRVGPPLSLGL